MKKIVLTLVAVMAMGMSAVAQDSLQTKRERKQFNPMEMVNHRTDRMVKAYGLNEEQATRLKALNLKYAETMRPQHGMHDRKNGNGMPGRKGFRPDMNGKRPQQPAMNDSVRQAMRKNFEAYDAELKSIMTEEQFKSYTADREKMMNRGPRGPRK